MGIKADFIPFNKVFSYKERKVTKDRMDAPVEYGKCYTHFFIYLQNPENGKKSKEVVTVFAYDELIIDWGQMIDGKTQFVFNLDYLEGDDLKMMTGLWFIKQNLRKITWQNSGVKKSLFKTQYITALVIALKMNMLMKKMKIRLL